MNTNLFILIIILAAFVFLIIGVYIGYTIANRDDKDTSGKVAKMDGRELFMKRHGLKK